MKLITTTMILVILAIFTIGCSIKAEERQVIDYDKYLELNEKYNNLANKYRSLFDKYHSLFSNLTQTTYLQEQIKFLSNQNNILIESLDGCEEKKTTFEEYNELKKRYSHYSGESFSVGLSDDQKMTKLARELRKNTIESTISNTENWVNNNTEYGVFWSIRSVETILRTKKGDCSDRANLIYELLWLNSIPVKRIHCYLDNGKHDSIEILYPADGWLYWKPLNKDCEKIGDGFW